MNSVFFCISLLITLTYFGIEQDIKGHVFYSNILLNKEVHGYASYCSFDEDSYIIQTIDNSHGQWEMKITEEGTFKVYGKKLIMDPKTKLVCPKLIAEWGYKGELAYTNEEKTDSFYIAGLNFCSEFSEYINVNIDTLAKKNRAILKFLQRSYTISKSNDEIVLNCSETGYRGYFQYPIMDYKYFRRRLN